MKKITNPNEAAYSTSPIKNLQNGEIDLFHPNKLKTDLHQSDLLQKEVFFFCISLLCEFKIRNLPKPKGFGKKP